MSPPDDSEQSTHRDSDDQSTRHESDDQSTHRDSDDCDSEGRDSDDEAPGSYVGEYDKLVRDDIPRVVRDDGNEPVTRHVDGREYERYLAAKLVEEATECADALESESSDALDAGGSDAVLDELADVHAVLEAIVAVSEHSRSDVESVADEKASERGGFADGIVLERIDLGE